MIGLYTDASKLVESDLETAYNLMSPIVLQGVANGHLMPDINKESIFDVSDYYGDFGYTINYRVKNSNPDVRFYFCTSINGLQKIPMRFFKFDLTKEGLFSNIYLLSCLQVINEQVAGIEVVADPIEGHMLTAADYTADGALIYDLLNIDYSYEIFGSQKDPEKYDFMMKDGILKYTPRSKENLLVAGEEEDQSEVERKMRNFLYGSVNLTEDGTSANSMIW